MIPLILNYYKIVINTIYNPVGGLLMKNFIEWCQEKGLTLEACHKEPIRAAKKIKGTKGDTGKYSGKVRKYYDDLSGDYKGNMAMNGTSEPFDVQTKGSRKPVADVAR
jgi:hypothetical protein